MERREQPRSPPSGDEHLEPADATTLGDAAVLFHDCRRYMPTRCGNNRSPAWRGSDLQGCRPWNWGRSESGGATRTALDGVGEIEALGYGTLWVGGSPSVEQARPFLERSSTLTVATGILNVWQHEPADVAAQRAELARAFPGRFLLGIGVGHPEATAEYVSPLAKMRAFFDGLDAAPEPVPKDERVAAALGPKMLELAAQPVARDPHVLRHARAHALRARAASGPDVLVAPELAVVVEPDDETARAIAREYAALYLGLSQLHQQPPALRLHRARRRRRRQRPADRRGRPARLGRSGRRGRPGAPRRGRRPRRAPATRPWRRAGGRLRGARQGPALGLLPLWRPPHRALVRGGESLSIRRGEATSGPPTLGPWPPFTRPSTARD